MHPAEEGTTGEPSAGLNRPLLRPGLELLAISFAVLFLELALIRWLPGQVRVLAYFPNLILISAFLGLGLGCLRAGRKPLLWLWPVAMLLLLAGAWGLSHIAFTQESESEYLWSLYFDLPVDAPMVRDMRPAIVWGFVMTATTFVPLGQLVAERLRVFRERASSLWGYAWDILGSLLGVVGFAVASFLGAFPNFWFAVVCTALLPFFLKRRRALLAYVASAAAILVLVSLAERADYYSPYYAVSTRPGGHEGMREAGRLPGLIVMTNGAFHQQALFLRKSDRNPFMGEDPTPRESQNRLSFQWHKRAYHWPYRFLEGPPENALVLGAGTGNDVAVLLDEGADRITAVEIDPVIIELGRGQHPNRPYDDPRVRIVNDDARSFLNHSEEEFDLIVFGTLDSLTRLSALSNVRLDNFVYTVDSLRAAASRMKPDGGMALLFGETVPFIRNRMICMLTEVFGEPPVIAYFAHSEQWIFLSGPAFERARRGEGDGAAERQIIEIDSDEMREILGSTEPPSDDWPFLYLKERGVSGFYLSLMAVFAGLAVVSVAGASRQIRSSMRRGRGIDFEMFFFGCAFLLLETRSVTEMNLVWGATWLTSAVVFGAILAMILFGTLLTAVRPLPWMVGVTGLGLSILIAAWLPTELLLELDGAARLLASVLLVGVPIFFASICFAIRFAQRQAPDLAFGWNLLGAVAGGLMEFLSMAMGLKALLFVALAAYAIVFVLERRSARDRSSTRSDLSSANA